MTIQVREYALLTCDNSVSGTMDLGIISPQTFDWLMALQERWGNSVQLLNREGTQFLRLGSYVGYLESPSGESIEILPKTQIEITDKPEPLRQVLRRMLQVSAGISPRQASAAALQRSHQPLHEWIFSEFLCHMVELVRRGLRFDYHLTEDNDSAFIRGQLDINRQVRQPPGRGTRFHVRYDEFTPQRIENRLLRTALDSVLKLTKDSQNWRMANTLSHQLSDIQPVTEPLLKIKSWSESKYLFAYRTIKPWCQLILEKMNPDFQKGLSRGISLLFPMDKLFEKWVGHSLANALHPGFSLAMQSKEHYLLTHTPVSNNPATESWFMLRPDFFIKAKPTSFVLDAKWKLLDARQANSSDKYGISQSDLYQMYAYGHKYLTGKGQMMLIYPCNPFFDVPLPPFHFDKNLTLWCVPFDVELGQLVRGEWELKFACLTNGFMSTEVYTV
ncbi:McrC family protein [Enterobacter sp.]|uniref:McrC family protein n=1 Tax=Enterobacter sp. TaxID=42895 RepID=UPI00296E8DCB|nr:McrC family protein [Enterobacter sp.]